MHSIYSIIFIAAVPFAAFAQTASDMVAKLEQLYKNAAGANITCLLPDGSKISMTLSSSSNAYKLVAKNDTYISDGTTLWHIFFQEKKVIVDNVKKDSKTVNAQALLDFSHNYDASLDSKKKGDLALTLKPHSNIASMFASVGDISAITFALHEKGKSLSVQSITAETGKEKLKLAKLKISPLKKIPANTFSYTPAKDMKVMDIRD